MKCRQTAHLSRVGIRTRRKERPVGIASHGTGASLSEASSTDASAEGGYFFWFTSFVAARRRFVAFRAASAHFESERTAMSGLWNQAPSSIPN